MRKRSETPSHALSLTHSFAPPAGLEGRAEHLEPDAEHVAQLLLAAERQYAEGGAARAGDAAAAADDDGAIIDAHPLPTAAGALKRGWLARAGPAAARFVVEQALTWEGVAARLAREWE